MTKIAAIALRDFSWNDRRYKKDQPLKLTGAELTELEHIGFAGRAEPKPRVARGGKASPAPDAPAPRDPVPGAEGPAT